MLLAFLVCVGIGLGVVFGGFMVFDWFIRRIGDDE